jgi:plasmid stabilization system protein ParE
MKIFLLPRAIFRLDNIYDYIRPFSEITASRIYNEILDEIGRIEHFPYIGQIEPSLYDCGKEFRALVVLEHYKVIYYIEEIEKAIYIATIWDCRQNPDFLRFEV